MTLPLRCWGPVTTIALSVACATTQYVADSVDRGGRSCDERATRALVGSGFKPDTVIIGRPDAWPGFKRVSGPPPRYPDELRRQNIQGEVRSSYVIDTIGHVVPGSIIITFETERQFGDAVCTFIKESRFAPMTMNGVAKTVRIVDQPTTFSLTR